MKRLVTFITLALISFGACAEDVANKALPCQNQCPAAQAQCPVNQQCPAAQGKCPIADCPYVGMDKCPAYNGNCPKANGQCPAVQGQCPLAGTDKCPAFNGNCPKVQAQQGCANPNWQRTSRCGTPVKGKKAVRHHRRGKSPCWRFSFCN